MVLWQAGHRGPTMLQAGKTVSRRFSRFAACWRHIPQAPSWQNCVLRLRTVRRFFAISGFQNRVARRSRRWRRWLEERRLSSQASRRCGGEPAGVRIIVATVAIVAQYVISLIRRNPGNAGNAKTVFACPRALADFRR